MVLDWALGFALGVFTTLFLIIVFDIRLFHRGDDEDGTAPKGLSGKRMKLVRRLSEAPAVVAVGGGTGLSTLLRGIKSFTSNITAVVAVTDEGGSSGRLKTEWGVLPPGDVRNCMVALAEDDSALKQIFDFRFDRGELDGHSLGNLLLLAASEMCGDFSRAVDQLNRLLAIRGRVLPVTTEAITLAGKTRSGELLKGELSISSHGSELDEIWLEPNNPQPLPDVMEAVDNADVILLGPGSLFTSVMPNLLLPDFAQKVRCAKAPKIYICNMMTQPEETEGMNIVQHIEWVAAALGAPPDCVVVNSEPLPEDVATAYFGKGSEPLYLDRRQRDAIRRMGCYCAEAPIVTVLDGNYLRHDPQKLASVIFKICRKYIER